MVVGCCGHAVSRIFQFERRLECVGHLFRRHLCFGHLGLPLDALIKNTSGNFLAVRGRCPFLLLDRTQTQVVGGHPDSCGIEQHSIHFNFLQFMDRRSQKNGRLCLRNIHVALCHADALELCLSRYHGVGNAI